MLFSLSLCVVYKSKENNVESVRILLKSLVI